VKKMTKKRSKEDPGAQEAFTAEMERSENRGVGLK
jgi:hypothetical protein